MCKCPWCRTVYTDLEEAGQASKTSCHKGRIIGDVVRGMAWPGQEGGFYFENNRKVLHVFKNKGTICSPFSSLKRAHWLGRDRQVMTPGGGFREGWRIALCLPGERRWWPGSGDKDGERNMSDLSLFFVSLNKVLLSNTEGHTHTLGIPGLNHSLHIGNGASQCLSMALANFCPIIL